ncbi:MAG: phage holin [Lachnospiraceae bacterium]|jgi:LL-H family phage holin|nr:phage holin [Lachnospiraceae bacterium]
MNDILFEILRLLVMLAVFVVTYSLLPWIRGKIGQDRLAEITKWVDTAVLMAQQVYQAKTGAERKAIVIAILKEMLTAKDISISDAQLDMLIEAAVKAMKMQENKI